MKRKTVIFSGALLLLAVAVVLIVSRNGTKVEAVTVEPGTITRTVQDTGYVQPIQKFDLSATVGTKVVLVPVARGQQVKKGQVLVKLQDQNLYSQAAESAANLALAEAGLTSARADLENARLALQQAQRDFDRTRQLYETGAGTRVQFEQDQTALATAQENWQAQNTLLQQAQAQVDSLQQSSRALETEKGQLVVTSPVDGVVLDLPAKQEQAVEPGALLVTVAASKGLEVKADILSDDMADVHVGQSATVTAPVLGGTVLTGRVTQIYPQAVIEESALGELQRRVPVIVSLPAAANLAPGYKVQVAVNTATLDKVLVVPREAVRTAPDGRKEVMAVVGNHVQYRVVTTGLADTDSVAVTSGLKAGDVVIKDATQDLPEDSRVSTGR